VGVGSRRGGLTPHRTGPATRAGELEIVRHPGLSLIMHTVEGSGGAGAEGPHARRWFRVLALLLPFVASPILSVGLIVGGGFDAFRYPGLGGPVAAVMALSFVCLSFTHVSVRALRWSLCSGALFHFVWQAIILFRLKNGPSTAIVAVVPWQSALAGATVAAVGVAVGLWQAAVSSARATLRAARPGV